MSAAAFTITAPENVTPEAATRIIDALTQRMRSLHIELQRQIVETKLSGQVLHERTGTLRRSIMQETAADGDVITSSVFTNTVYAAIHEYGGTITPKRAGALVFEIDGRLIFTTLVKIPPRPYMVPTFQDMRGEIIFGLQDAIEGALES